MRKILLCVTVFMIFFIHEGECRSLPDSNPDIELLRKQCIDELMAPNVNSGIKELITTLNADGSWPDINYEDVSNTGFQHTRHLSNLIAMSHAYKKKGSVFKGKKELKNAIDLALDFWTKNDFICDNWWHNEIGTPRALTTVLLIMENDLTKTQIEKTLAITGRAHINAWGARQSGDRIKIAGIQAKNALFKRDVPSFEMLLKVIENEIRFVPDNERGLQYDYSFHHRDDRVNNTLTYGTEYADVFVDWAVKVAKTRYRFTDRSVNLLVDYYLDGICKMLIYGKYPDPGASNREISRMGNGQAFSVTTPKRLMNITGYRKDELQQIVNTRQNNTMDVLPHSTFFRLSEHYTHQRPGYFTSVRMFSSRVHNMEVPYNGEGILNHHRGDGANYISLSGTEYFSITPVYDWQKIPGTTTMQKPSLPSEKELQKPGFMDFAGAVTDGKYGAVGFDFISSHDPLRAHKAWFFFDREFVCLGAGITCDKPAVTTLDQCLLSGDVSVGNGETDRIISKGKHSLDSTAWVYHNGIGYLFPTPVPVVLSNQAQTGSWYQINRQASTSRAEVNQDVFKLWIDHGTQADNAEYQYIVMPASTKAEIEAANRSPKVEILANTQALQAVWHLDLQVLQAVFYQNGEISLPDGSKITTEAQGMMMIRIEDGKIREITVSDPSRKLGKFHFSINSKLNIHVDNAYAVWNDLKGVSEISVDLPQGFFKGKSVTINF